MFSSNQICFISTVYLFNFIEWIFKCYKPSFEISNGWIIRYNIWIIFYFIERDELRKDIEQLCMQQAGPSYLVVATRMHFQRYNSFFSVQMIYLPLSLFPPFHLLLVGRVGWKGEKGVPVALVVGIIVIKSITY